MPTELMPVFRTRCGAWLLGLAGVAGFCFLMSGVIEAAKGPDRGRGVAYLTGGAAVIAAAVVIRLLAVTAGSPPGYGPADLARYEVSDLLEEARRILGQAT